MRIANQMKRNKAELQEEKNCKNSVTEQNRATYLVFFNLS